MNRGQREKQVQQDPGDHQAAEGRQVLRALQVYQGNWVPRVILDFLDCQVLQAYLVVRVTGVQWVNQDLKVNKVHLDQKEMEEKRVT